MNINDAMKWFRTIKAGGGPSAEGGPGSGHYDHSKAVQQKISDRDNTGGGGAHYESSKHLSDAMKRAAAAHHEYEQKTGKPDANWAEWYADYMVKEHAGQQGEEPDRHAHGHFRTIWPIAEKTTPGMGKSYPPK